MVHWQQNVRPPGHVNLGGGLAISTDGSCDNKEPTDEDGAAFATLERREQQKNKDRFICDEKTLRQHMSKEREDAAAGSREQPAN
jgi:hypothetical protein